MSRYYPQFLAVKDDKREALFITSNHTGWHWPTQPMDASNA